MLRAGFTDVFVTGMLIRWISVSARPIARPAKPGRRALVRGAEDDDQEHEGHHDFGDRRRAEAVLARRVLAEAVRREAALQVEAGLAAGDQVEHAGRDDGAEHLRHDVRAAVATAGKRPPAQRPTETAGLKCPPEIGPSA